MIWSFSGSAFSEGTEGQLLSKSGICSENLRRIYLVECTELNMNASGACVNVSCDRHGDRPPVGGLTVRPLFSQWTKKLTARFEPSLV